MSGYTPEPEYVPSPWLEQIPDEAASILATTLFELAKACGDRYEQQIDRHRQIQRRRLLDPDRPWMPRSAESAEDWSHDDQEDLAADFNARQLDLFRPEEEWDNDF
jgi:hypothetical protein